MTAPTFDALAGERARAIRAYPGTPQPIVDPTDPRCRELFLGSRSSGASYIPIADPTDPNYGRPAV
jgi:hypothetical protein